MNDKWNEADTHGPPRRARYLLLVAGLLGALITLTSSRPAPDSAEPFPRGDLPGWERVVGEDFATDVRVGEFTASLYSPRLHTYQGLTDTFRHGTYSPDRVLSVQDGILDWHLHTDDGVSYVSAVVVTDPETGWGRTYGRYSVRFRTEVVPGYKIAFLLWPDSDDWGEGEIDFPESHELTAEDTIVVNVFEPGTAPGRPGPSDGVTTAVRTADSGWHVATIEWMPDSINFVLDGERVMTKTSGVPNTPMHWVLQVETAHAGPPDHVTGHVQVDWVTIHAPSGARSLRPIG